MLKGCSLNHCMPIYCCSIKVATIFFILRGDLVAEAVMTEALHNFTSTCGTFSSLGKAKGSPKQIFDILSLIRLDY